MKTSFAKLFSLFALVLSMSAFTATAAGPWLTDIEAGVAKAKAENKLVMIEFTGSDWCAPCQVMQKEVFSKEEFLKGAQENYVLVKIDMPKSDPKLSKMSKALMIKYKVKGVPTVLLFDTEGKEFNRFSATQHRTVADFIKRLNSEKRRKDMF